FGGGDFLRVRVEECASVTYRGRWPWGSDGCPASIRRASVTDSLAASRSGDDLHPSCRLTDQDGENVVESHPSTCATRWDQSSFSHTARGSSLWLGRQRVAHLGGLAVQGALLESGEQRHHVGGVLPHHRERGEHVVG